MNDLPGVAEFGHTTLRMLCFLIRLFGGAGREGGYLGERKVRISKRLKQKSSPCFNIPCEISLRQNSAVEIVFISQRKTR